MRQMHLSAFLIAGHVAHSHALWRHPALPVRVCLADSEMPTYQASQTKIGKISKSIA
jgi:hypothetical protein